MKPEPWKSPVITWVPSKVFGLRSVALAPLPLRPILVASPFTVPFELPVASHRPEGRVLLPLPGISRSGPEPPTMSPGAALAAGAALIVQSEVCPMLPLVAIADTLSTLVWLVGVTVMVASSSVAGTLIGRPPLSW